MSRHILIVDIETVAYDNANECLEPFFLDIKTRNKLDERKVAEEKQAKKDKMINKAALTPMASKVVAIGLGHVIYNDPSLDNTFEEPTSMSTQLLYIENDNEKALIEEFKKIVETRNYNEFVTFNGRRFDFPYLMFRASILGINLKLPMYYKNTFDGHFDLAQHIYDMSLISNIDSTIQYVSMKKWIRFFGINIEKKDVIEMDYIKDKEEFLEYLNNDIKITYEFFLRFANHFEGRFSR